MQWRRGDGGCYYSSVNLMLSMQYCARREVLETAAVSLTYCKHVPATTTLQTNVQSGQFCTVPLDCNTFREKSSLGWLVKYRPPY